jgi:hypothetical protein
VRDRLVRVELENKQGSHYETSLCCSQNDLHFSND